MIDFKQFMVLREDNQQNNKPNISKFIELISGIIRFKEKYLELDDSGYKQEKYNKIQDYLKYDHEDKNDFELLAKFKKSISSALIKIKDANKNKTLILNGKSSWKGKLLTTLRGNIEKLNKAIQTVYDNKTDDKSNEATINNFLNEAYAIEFLFRKLIGTLRKKVEVNGEFQNDVSELQNLLKGDIGIGKIDKDDEKYGKYKKYENLIIQIFQDIFNKKINNKGEDVEEDTDGGNAEGEDADEEEVKEEFFLPGILTEKKFYFNKEVKLTKTDESLFALLNQDLINKLEELKKLLKKFLKDEKDDSDKARSLEIINNNTTVIIEICEKINKGISNSELIKLIFKNEIKDTKTLCINVKSEIGEVVHSNVNIGSLKQFINNLKIDKVVSKIEHSEKNGALIPTQEGTSKSSFQNLMLYITNKPDKFNAKNVIDTLNEHKREGRRLLINAETFFMFVNTCSVIRNGKNLLENLQLVTNNKPHINKQNKTLSNGLGEILTKNTEDASNFKLTPTGQKLDLIINFLYNFALGIKPGAIKEINARKEEITKAIEELSAPEKPGQQNNDEDKGEDLDPSDKGYVEQMRRKMSEVAEKNKIDPNNIDTSSLENGIGEYTDFKTITLPELKKRRGIEHWIGAFKNHFLKKCYEYYKSTSASVSVVTEDEDDLDFNDTYEEVKRNLMAKLEGNDMFIELFKTASVEIEKLADELQSSLIDFGKIIVNPKSKEEAIKKALKDAELTVYKSEGKVNNIMLRFKKYGSKDSRDFDKALRTLNSANGKQNSFAQILRCIIAGLFYTCETTGDMAKKWASDDISRTGLVTGASGAVRVQKGDPTAQGDVIEMKRISEVINSYGADTEIFKKFDIKAFNYINNSEAMLSYIAKKGIFKKGGAWTKEFLEYNKTMRAVMKAIRKTEKAEFNSSVTSESILSFMHGGKLILEESPAQPNNSPQQEDKNKPVVVDGTEEEFKSDTPKGLALRNIFAKLKVEFKDGKIYGYVNEPIAQPEQTQQPENQQQAQPEQTQQPENQQQAQQQTNQQKETPAGNVPIDASNAEVTKKPESQEAKSSEATGMTTSANCDATYPTSPKTRITTRTMKKGDVTSTITTKETF